MVKNLPALQETLGWEDPLEKGMATHSSVLAWIIPWTKEPGGLQSMTLQKVMTEWLSTAQHSSPLVCLWVLPVILIVLFDNDLITYWKSLLFLHLTSLAAVMAIVIWYLVKNTQSRPPPYSNWIRILSLISSLDLLYAHEVWEAMKNWHCFAL